MAARVSIASIVFLLWRAVALGATPADSMSLPVPAADLASAIGLTRTDTANLPLDLVRSLYASPESSASSAEARTAVRRLLATPGAGPDRVPLPLGAAFWRQSILLTHVADDRLAAAILGSRTPALIYHGLLSLDTETLEWLAHAPRAVEAFRKHPGATAVFARSLHIRSGALSIPPSSAVIWQELVGASAADPESFIVRLFGGRNGRLAFLFDTIMHLDGAHQKFALAPARGESASARARALLDVAADAAPTWKIDDRPFLRPDVDLALLLRLVAVTDEGTLESAGSRELWDRGFGDRVDTNADSGDSTPVDAAWLAGRILRPPAIVARQRLDLFLQAQRVLPDAMTAPSQHVLQALRGFTRYPALAVTLERIGVRGGAAYAAPQQTAATLQQDPDGTALFQALLAVIDDVRASGRLSRSQSAQFAASLVETAGAGRPAGARLAQWAATQLVPALVNAAGIKRGTNPSAEKILLDALGGPLADHPPAIEWEGRPYQVDAAAAERKRIEHIRNDQAETPLDRALANASSPQGVREVIDSLTALLYAVALGDPDGQALTGGPVWRRHRFRADATPEEATWRIAAESFGPGGWHLTGSLLALDAAVPMLALRRLDSTDVPAPTQLSTSDRRTLSLTIALMERPMLTAEGQAAVAAAIAGGRERLRELAADHALVAAITRDAGLSEWRANGVAWMLATDPRRVGSLFTLTDLYRLGRGRTADGAWGGAAMPLDGSLALRGVNEPWEEFTGRPATGQLGSQFIDVQLRTAEALAEFHLPASIGREVAALAMQDVLDHAQPAYFDDFLSLAFAARDLSRERFEDYVAALTAAGPLFPASKGIVTRH